MTRQSGDLPAQTYQTGGVSGMGHPHSPATGSGWRCLPVRLP